MPRGSASSRRLLTTAGACVLLVVLVAGVYGQTAGFGFIEIYDDHYYLSDNPHVPQGLTAEGVRWAFTGRYKPYWQPVAMLSHMLDVELFGLNSGPHHLVNSGLHALNAVLLLLLLRAATGALWRSFFAAALLAAHPLHVESVAWIAERKDVLSASLLLLTVFSYLRYCRRPGPARYAVVAAAFAAGCMAKPMIVTLPFALLLLDWWPLGRWGRAAAVRLLAEKTPLIALSVAVSVITVLVQSSIGALSSLDQLPLEARLANAALSCAKYLGKLGWPSRLAIAYPLPAGGIPALQVAGALLLLAAITWLALRERRRPQLATGWFWFLLCLVPVLGFVQSGTQAMADRFMYVPALGLYVAIAWIAGDLVVGLRAAARPIAVAVAGIAVLSLAAAAHSQVRYWRDGVALFGRAVALTPQNVEARKTLAKALILAGRPGEAVAHSRAALRLRPNSPEIHNDLGAALYGSGAREEGGEHILAALRLRPDYVEALANLATLRLDQGRFGEAVALAQRALSLAPGNAAILKQLEVARRRIARESASPAR